MSDYISLDEFKVTSELQGFNFADYDAQRAISAASSGIDQYTGRFFYQANSGGTQTRYYSPLDPYCLLIDDVVTLGTVAIDRDRNGTFETTLTLNTDFVVEPLNGPADGKPYEEIQIVPWSGVWLPCWPRSVQVTGVFGWAAVPEPVKEACTILATRLLRRAREAPFGVVGLGVDNVAVRISRVDSDVAFLLDPYRKGDGVLAA